MYNLLCAGGAPPRGSVASALRQLSAAGVEPQAIASSFSKLAVCPVLTAHPTEVQRRSILDTESEITRLLRTRYGGGVILTPEEEEENDAKLHRLTLQLWQTAMLRLHKLKVTDEINNVLVHFKNSFVHVVPKLYASLDKQIGALVAETAAAAVGDAGQDATGSSGSNDASPTASGSALTSSPEPSTPIGLPMTPLASSAAPTTAPRSGNTGIVPPHILARLSASGGLSQQQQQTYEVSSPSVSGGQFVIGGAETPTAAATASVSGFVFSSNEGSSGSGKLNPSASTESFTSEASDRSTAVDVGASSRHHHHHHTHNEPASSPLGIHARRARARASQLAPPASLGLPSFLQVGPVACRILLFCSIQQCNNAKNATLIS